MIIFHSPHCTEIIVLHHPPRPTFTLHLEAGSTGCRHSAEFWPSHIWERTPVAPVLKRLWGKKSPAQHWPWLWITKSGNLEQKIIRAGGLRSQMKYIYSMCICVCVHAHVSLCTCGGQRTSSESQVWPCVVWASGIEVNGHQAEWQALSRARRWPRGELLPSCAESSISGFLTEPRDISLRMWDGMRRENLTCLEFGHDGEGDHGEPPWVSWRGVEALTCSPTRIHSWWGD